MQLNQYLIGYKLGRFFFAIFFSFFYFIYLNIIKVIPFNIPIVVVIVYSIVAFVLLFSKKVIIWEFILDISFITVFMLFNYNSVFYLSILYLFPIFFYSLLTGKNNAYILSVISFISYISVRYMYNSDGISNLLIPSFLHGFSFFIIAFAGIALNKRLEQQQKEIKILEDEKKKTQMYKKLYEISANLAHEIKNPLASISGAAQLIKEGKINEKLVDIIYKESKRVDELLKDFLRLTDPYKENEEIINLDELINEIVKSHTLGKKIILNTKPIKIRANKKAIYSLIDNIFKNALYWSKSKVKITLNNNDENLILIIEDDGKGISEDIKDKIFDPFFTENPKGTGLGLAIAKNIAINLDGNILVSKSEELGGAKFIIKLPIKAKNESINS